MGSVGCVVAVVLAVVPLSACGGVGDLVPGGGGAPEVLAQTDLDGIPGDVTAVDGAVWVAAVGEGGGLVELDADTLGTIAVLDVAGGADAVAVGEEFVWALTAESGDVTVFERSAASGEEGSGFDIEIDSSDLETDEPFEDIDTDGAVAYASGEAGVRRVTADGDVLAPPAPDDEYDYGLGDDLESELAYEDVPVVVASSAVWAATEDGLTRFDPDALTPLDDSTGSDDVDALAADGDVVWSVEDGTVVRHAEGVSGEEIADLEDRFPDDESPEAIAFADGTLWLVAAGQVLRLDPGTGEEVGDPLLLPGGTEEAGYAVSRGPEDGTVVVVQRPTHRVWLVGSD